MTENVTEATAELVDLEIVEGSFVDKGDNPEAHIVFFKRAEDEAKMYDEEKMYPRTTKQIMNEMQASKTMHECKMAFEQSMKEIIENATADELPMLLERSAREFADEMKMCGMDHGTAKRIEAELRSVFTTPSVEQMRDGITKALDALTVDADGTTEEKVKKTEESAKTFDEVVAALPEAEQAIVRAKFDESSKAAEAEVEAAKAAVAEKAQAESEVSKRLASLEKRAEAAEAEVEKMKDEKLTAHFTDVAKQIGGGDVDEMATLLKGAYGRSDVEGQQLETMLRGMAAQAKLGQQALFKTVGSTAPGIDDSSPEAIIEAEAQKLMEADASLKYHSAYKLALQKNRDVYAKTVRVRSVAE